MKKTLWLIALTGVALASAFPALAQDAPQPVKEKAPPPAIAAAITSLPPFLFAAGNGSGQACTYQYYYDAAHTQPSGVCYGACYAGGNFCEGVVTDYSAIAWCDVCGCGGGTC